MRRLALLLVLGCVSVGHAKPIGAFDPPDAVPWLSFGSLPDFASDADLAAAQARCAGGFRWIVQIGMGRSPVEPIGPHAAAVKARFDALGFSPCIVGMTIGEEWYTRWRYNEFAPYGFPASLRESVAVPVIHDWLGRQHTSARAATGWPVIWLEIEASDRFPVPVGTDYVAIDAYPSDAETFDRIEAVYLAAERATDVPLILVPRWFVTDLDGWRHPPRPDILAGYARILARPRWVAMWGWLGRSRPPVLGLSDLPALREAISRSLEIHGFDVTSTPNRSRLTP